MKFLTILSWNLYISKFLFLFAWLAHSIYLTTFPYSLFRVNINVIWNLICSIYLIILDVLGHILNFIRRPKDKTSKRDSIKVLFAIFWLLAGPILLTLTVYGSLTDSINYDMVFCRRGCVWINQLISILLKDIHFVVLFIMSIFSFLGFCVYCHSILFENEAVTNMCMNYEGQRHITRQSTLVEPWLIDGISDCPYQPMYRSVST